MVPSNSRGSTPWMRWNSALHCTVPVGTSHSHRPTCARASLSCSRASDSASNCCAMPLLGGVHRDRHRAAARAVGVDDRVQRQRDRHGHPGAALEGRLPPVDPVTRQHRVDERRGVLTEVAREQNWQRTTEHVVGRVAAEPFRATVPEHDASLCIHREHRVVRGVDEGLEHRESSRRRGIRLYRPREATPVSRRDAPGQRPDDGATRDHGRGPGCDRARVGAPLLRRRHDVVPRSRLAGARAPRGGRVRAPGDHGQARTAGGRGGRRRPGLVPARAGAPRRRPARGAAGESNAAADRARAGPDLGADHRVDRVRAPSRARGSRSRGLGRRRRSAPRRTTAAWC